MSYVGDCFYVTIEDNTEIRTCILILEKAYCLQCILFRRNVIIIIIKLGINKNSNLWKIIYFKRS